MGQEKVSVPSKAVVSRWQCREFQGCTCSDASVVNVMQSAEARIEHGASRAARDRNGCVEGRDAYIAEMESDDVRKIGGSGDRNRAGGKSGTGEFWSRNAALGDACANVDA